MDEDIAVAVTRPAQAFRRAEVLKGVSLTARTGEVISIIGASGSGKSTLLRCIPLLEVPEEGEVAIAGEAVPHAHAAAAPASPPTPARSTGCARRSASSSRASICGST